MNTTTPTNETIGVAVGSVLLLIVLLLSKWAHTVWCVTNREWCVTNRERNSSPGFRTPLIPAPLR